MSYLPAILSVIFSKGRILHIRGEPLLQIKHISKKYKTGDYTQQALSDVSLNLRDNEFVAILGPSGSGKTTLLNIIGGLDRYDSGDLIINGVSTKKYKDRDWDAYRNHTIGFVFQSYNLIMHQSVLANVELALTISGISGSERRKRAEDALRKVGLGQQMHKKPNQMSGGQMQRVAIARALVNNPDIVLADEPTGALDSDTSVQIMNLLQEVAQDRLVVMVTHNPELAKQYATRIVRIRDGRLEADSNPYPVEEEEKEPVHKRLGKASMSFLTALQLSFNNLKTKKARTILVAVAGSIGIIGIALILSLSHGVNRYINEQEEATLAEYPLQIEKTGYDLNSIMRGQNGSTSPSGSSDSSSSKHKKGSSSSKSRKNETVSVMNVASSLFTKMSNNDLKSLKSFLSSKKSGIRPYVNAIEYSYDVTPQIYLYDKDNSKSLMEKDKDYIQVNPNHVFTDTLSDLGQSQMTSIVNNALSSNLFSALPEDKALYEKQYTVKAGHWPKNDQELVLVLSNEGRVSDLLLYAMGLKDESELTSLMRGYVDELKTQISPDSATVSSQETESQSSVSRNDNSSKPSNEKKESFTYRDFLGRTFRLVQNSDFYAYDSQYGIWTDKSDNKAYMDQLVKNGKKLKIVGIVQPKSESGQSILNQGICYPQALVKDIMKKAAGSDIVKAQLADPGKNVLTGKSFSDDSAQNQLDLSKLFTVDTNALQKAFQVNPDQLGSVSANGMSGDLSSLLGSASSGKGGDSEAIKKALSGLDLKSLGLDPSSMNLQDLGNLIDADSLAKSLPSLTDVDLNQLLSGVKITATQDQIENLFKDLLSGYMTYAAKDPSTDYTKLTDAVEDYLKDDAARSILISQVKQLIYQKAGSAMDLEDVRSVLEKALGGYETYVRDQDLDPNDFSENLQKYLSDEGTQSYLKEAQTIIEEKIRALKITNEDVQTIASALLNGYQGYAKEKNLPDPSNFSASLSGYLQSGAVQKELGQAASSMINTDEVQKAVASALQSTMQSVAANIGTQISSAVSKIMEQAMTQIASQLQNTISQAIQSIMQNLMKQMQSQIGNMFHLDPSVFANAIKMNLTPDEMQELLTSLLSGNTSASYDKNLASFGYADPDSPSEISIYAKDFAAKNHVSDILKKYNEDMKKAGQDEKVITYTDLMASMMSSVTNIVNTITYVLVAFVAISLVVSSIMIGVITYISVLERRKEIGILRAIGASKHNIAQVFNAETFITGLLAGLIGIGVTLALIPVANYAIHRVTGRMEVNASLPPLAAILLIALSIFLTLMSGLIPAGKASRSDPVKALRTE